MRFILKALVLLIFLGGIGLIGYAFLADLSPPRGDVILPVQINVD